MMFTQAAVRSWPRCSIGMGILAQEVEEVFPELVSRYGPDQEYRSVDYDGLTSVLIGAVKDLKR
jgi:hypothetical protein